MFLLQVIFLNRGKYFQKRRKRHVMNKILYWCIIHNLGISIWWWKRKRAFIHIQELVEPPQVWITTTTILGRLSTSPCMTTRGVFIHSAWSKQVCFFTDFGQSSHPLIRRSKTSQRFSIGFRPRLWAEQSSILTLLSPYKSFVDLTAWQLAFSSGK